MIVGSFRCFGWDRMHLLMFLKNWHQIQVLSGGGKHVLVATALQSSAHMSIHS